MAIIPLRTYNREIEDLIEAGQLDEAVAYCRHILTTFPKHIATYRLLGKAHLEQQRISDATDIFQRVLSAIPEDFIANVGMSIIREDENNLDAAIWHMELAYEAQPSNVAIQEELRRLYGRREGMQAPKVRLTRGTLARMYAKGSLYEQAIAELRSAIDEDPNRSDLQLLLAQMFFQVSQRVEAVEVCVAILKKLPFCLSANQILAVCLPESDVSGTGKNYRQVAIAMDPYFAFAGPEAITSDQVPENAVNLEKLEWKSGIKDNEPMDQPGWATSLGISLETPSVEKLPDWLKAAESPVSPEMETPPANVSPFIWDTQEVEKIITDASAPEDEIPDWMKDAGWKPATGEATPEDTEAVESLEDEGAGEEELARAEMPDWLRGIAPDGLLEEKDPSAQAEEKETPLPWLEKREPGPTDSIIQWLEDKRPEAPITPPETINAPGEVVDEEIPDWLKDLGMPVIPTVQPEKPAVDAGILPSMSAFIEEPPSAEPTGTIEPESMPTVEPTAEIEEAEEITPVSEAFTTPQDMLEEVIPSPIDEELPDWIKELAGVLPTPAPSGTTLAAQETELPAAIEENEISVIPTLIGETPAAEMAATFEDVQEETPSIEAPAFTGEIPAIEMETMISGEETSDAHITADVPAEEPERASVELNIDEPSALPEVEALEGESAILDGLPEAELQPSTDGTIPEEQIAAGAVEPSVELPAIPVEPDSLAWLDEFTSEDTEKEALLEPLAGDELAERLEWVTLESEAAGEQISQEPQPQEEEAPALPAEEIPDWIRGLGEPLQEEAPTQPIEASALEPEKLQEEELPTWLQDLEPPAVTEEALPTSQEVLEWKDKELPEWIKEITEVTSSSEPEAIEEPPVIPDEAVAEWTAEEAVPAPSVAEEPEISQEQELGMMAEAEFMEQPATPVLEEVETLPELEVIEELREPEEGITAPPPVHDTQPHTVTVESDLESLETAREALSRGLIDEAVSVYTGLIKENLHLDEVLKDLQDALYQYPVDVNLWVALGDAHFRTHSLQEALDAYTKAEEFVR
jgi:tetratricopeptide (TPR) repeat protein